MFCNTYLAKNENGYAQIDVSRCLSCGACVARCPFGAVAEKSQIIDILKDINNKIIPSSAWKGEDGKKYVKLFKKYL